MPFLLDLALRELRVNGRSLWVFCVCLMLGVILVAAAGGLYRIVSTGLLADTRELLGGDLEVDSATPLTPAALEWIEDTGDMALVTELDTMLGTEDGSFVRAELLAVDAAYPLYGQLLLEPAMPLAQAMAQSEGRFGGAIDAALAARLGIDIGDMVYVGDLELELRAIVVNQPDRRLSADWRGAPLLLSEAALAQTGLILPGSRVDYEYHVRTDVPVDTWREQFLTAFPGHAWQVRTFHDRSQRIAERLNQIASGLLIIGLSTLFIGGLGVFNSIESYLSGRLKTIATLRAIGMRRRPLGQLYLLQVAILAGLASLAGALIGLLLALAGSGLIEAQLPIGVTASGLVGAALIALCFGLLTAFAFTFPAIGRALAANPAALFRGSEPGVDQVPLFWWGASLTCAAGLIGLVLLVLPDALFGLGFVALIIALLLVLEMVLRLIRLGARALDARGGLPLSFPLRLALANLHRPGTSLRSSLLSLGSALTLLVACTLVVVALLRALNTTIPDEAPALVLYDVLDNHAGAVVDAVREAAPAARVDLAPLVLSRIIAVNGKPLEQREYGEESRTLDVRRDDYKLSYRLNNIDDVRLVAGEWWSEPVDGMAQMAMEDREVGRLGVELGDVITFTAVGKTFDARIGAIYSQKGLQTRFWFEAIVSDGALEGLISRQIGAVYADDAAAIEAQKNIARVAPSALSVRTARLLETARGILGKAASGLAVVAAISLFASLLVLISLIAAGRTRQIYDATILHALGARIRQLRRGLRYEYLLLAAVTSSFAVLLGAAIALPLLRYRLKLPSEDLLWLGALVAIAISVLSLALGTRYLLGRLRLNPIRLLRRHH